MATKKLAMLQTKKQIDWLVDMLSAGSQVWRLLHRMVGVQEMDGFWLEIGQPQLVFT